MFSYDFDIFNKFLTSFCTKNAKTLKENYTFYLPYDFSISQKKQKFCLYEKLNMSENCNFPEK